MARVRPAWTLVLSAGVMLAINMGIRQAFGLYLKPISQDLDLDRQVFSLAMALVNLVWGLGAPFAGALSDKLGAVRIVLGGTCFYVAGLLLMATASGAEQLLLAGPLIGLGIAGTGFTAIFGVIARAAPPERRASALGNATMGSAIGQFLSVPFVHLALDATGWINSLLLCAASVGLIVPLAFAFRSGEADGSDRAAGGEPEQRLAQALGEALRHPSFLFLTAGFFVCGFQLAAVATHFPAFLTDKGFEPGLGATALAVIGGANIIGTYGCGKLGDLISKRIALSLLYLARGAMFICLLYLPLSQLGVLIYAFLMGLLWLGTVPLTSGLIVTFFGPRWLSMLYGIVFLSHQVGSFLGAWLGGLLYDTYRSYDALWWLSAAVALVAAVLHLPIREAPARLVPVPAE